MSSHQMWFTVISSIDSSVYVQKKLITMKTILSKKITVLFRASTIKKTWIYFCNAVMVFFVSFLPFHIPCGREKHAEGQEHETL